MRCVIYDSTNNGVIFVTDQLAIGNMLAQGILDCDTTVLNDEHVPYTRELLKITHLRFNLKEVKMEALPASAINPFYLEKKALIALRFPYMIKLTGLVRWALRKVTNTAIPGIENDIKFALLNSDTTQDQYHYSVLDYALITGMTAAEAYTELKLVSDSYSTQKIRAYAYSEYFSKLINAAKTETELQLVMAQVEKKFIQDSYI